MPNQQYDREVNDWETRSSRIAGMCCAYNQTRKRFLCADVEVVEFNTGLDTRLATLVPGSSSALWIVPFRGISATDVRVPVDLLYMSQDGLILDAVESFPIAMVTGSSAPAASVLALPAGTIAKAGVFPGDQLILCDPEEMKQRLLQEPGHGSETRPEHGDDHAVSVRPSGGQGGRVLPWIHRPETNPAEKMEPAEALPVAEPQPPEAVPAPEVDLAEPRQKPAKPTRNWLQRLLLPDPPDLRKAPRRSMQGLAAYFFTGGSPQAHAVRDISLTGMYVLTGERWYLGTIIRMTLTNLRNPAGGASITVNGKVVRWGNDGVGLQFLFQDDRKGSRPGVTQAGDGPVQSIQKAQIEKFLKPYMKRQAKAAD